MDAAAENIAELGFSDPFMEVLGFDEAAGAIALPLEAANITLVLGERAGKLELPADAVPFKLAAPPAPAPQVISASVAGAGPDVSVIQPGSLAIVPWTGSSLVSGGCSGQFCA